MPKLLPRSHLAQSFVSTFLGPKSALPRGAKTTKFSHRMHQRQTDQCELITRRSQTLAQRLVFAGTKKKFHMGLEGQITNKKGILFPNWQIFLDSLSNGSLKKPD